MRKFVFVIMIFIGVFCVANNVFGKSDKNETYISYEEVAINNGDSYWDIAERYSSDGMSKKEYTKYIMDFNKATSEDLQAGQRIIVPIIKYV